MCLTGKKKRRLNDTNTPKLKECIILHPKHFFRQFAPYTFCVNLTHFLISGHVLNCRKPRANYMFILQEHFGQNIL